MTKESRTDIIKRYLEDAIAAERTFESQLRGMATEGNNERVKQAFLDHADETRSQYDRLEARLRQIGGSPSTMKSVLAHIFAFPPKAAQLGHEEEERTTQNLIIAYTVENSEIAMYEALAAVASAAGDTPTEQLAREIQKEEERTRDKVWSMLAPCAVSAFEALVSAEQPVA
jgi:ferritin-like metal-binding protein YciE